MGSIENNKIYLRMRNRGLVIKLMNKIKYY